MYEVTALKKRKKNCIDFAAVDFVSIIVMYNKSW